MGRCIYGGLYDPSSPFADKHGWRQDVIDVMKELRVPCVRYPGGNFTATYRWQDGIGPREKRPKRYVSVCVRDVISVLERSDEAADMSMTCCCAMQLGPIYW